MFSRRMLLEETKTELGTPYINETTPEVGARKTQISI
jgi:hypothetical protein